MSAAAKALAFIGKGEFSASPEIAKILSEKCNLCGKCISICPVKASVILDSEVKINPISCVGCGICVIACPNEAIDLKNCTEKQLINQIQSVSQSDTQPRIIAFLDQNTAYASADYAGQMRFSYTPNVRIIAVPSTGRIGLKHILHAFASGADGIALIEGDGGPFTEDMLRKHIRQLSKDLAANGIEPLRLISTTTTIPQYNKILELFDILDRRIKTLGRIKVETRREIKENLK
jgi:heterodisulfide reductase subunit A